MGDEVFAVAGKHVDDGYLDHRVASGLQAHGGASHVDQHLTSEGRVLSSVICSQKLKHIVIKSFQLAISIH